MAKDMQSNEHNQGRTSGMQLHGQVTREVWDAGQLALEARVMRALHEGTPGYPIYRMVRVAVRLDLEAVMDDIALNLGCRAHRLDSQTLILDGDGVYIVSGGARKADYASCVFHIW